MNAHNWFRIAAVVALLWSMATACQQKDTTDTAQAHERSSSSAGSVAEAESPPDSEPEAQTPSCVAERGRHPNTATE